MRDGAREGTAVGRTVGVGVGTSVGFAVRRNFAIAFSIARALTPGRPGSCPCARAAARLSNKGRRSRRSRRSCLSGRKVGAIEGTAVGAIVGTRVGLDEGRPVCAVSPSLDDDDEDDEDDEDDDFFLGAGEKVGVSEGEPVGRSVGVTLGVIVGTAEWAARFSCLPFLISGSTILARNLDGRSAALLREPRLLRAPRIDVDDDMHVHVLQDDEK